MKLVGLVSTYLEGELSKAAVESVQECGLDDLLVYEGPCGDPLDGDIPASVFPTGTPVKRGRWRTDGRKRNDMVQEAKQRHPGPYTWAIVVDGDEILGNGRYVRDILQAVEWGDDPSDPVIRYPIWQIEVDGALALAGGRLYRLDLVRSNDISGSVFTNVHGVQEGWGHVRASSRIWIDHFLGAVDRGHMCAWPPLPCDPYIYHRSHLRHPLRRGLRMHEQEAEELRKAGLLPAGSAGATVSGDGR